MPGATPGLREQVGLAIGDCARIWRDVVNERLRPLGLSQSTWLTLWTLARFPEGLRQADLAQRLGIEGPTLVRLLDRLERDGLLERRASSRDRRCKLVHLTPQAQPVLAQVREIIAALRMEIMGELPEDELAVSLAVLQRICDHLSRVKKGDQSP